MFIEDLEYDEDIFDSEEPETANKFDDVKNDVSDDIIDDLNEDPDFENVSVKRELKSDDDDASNFSDEDEVLASRKRKRKLKLKRNSDEVVVKIEKLDNSFKDSGANEALNLPKEFQCDECEDVFGTNPALRIHKKRLLM